MTTVAKSTEGAAGTKLWRDASAPADDRVRDLMSRMSLREKVAQLSGIWVGADPTDGQVAPQHESAPKPAPWPDLIRHGVGQMTRLYGTAPVDPVAEAQVVAATQRQITATGPGIPAIVHEECLTGLAAWQAPIYPAPLSWGASFDPDLVRRMAVQIGSTMRRLGIHQGLAPVLDVTRDLRWGRTEETIAEDPYLVSTIGAAYVSGLESTGVVATVKHFAGYSTSRAGRNLAPVSIGPRELADVILPPFEAALRAGVRSVMNSYTDLDGVPSAADASLLTERLRGTYGFTGTVVSDYFAIPFLETWHKTAGSSSEAAAQALAAGIDVELPNADCYGAPLLEAVESGLVDLALIDRAVERVLTQKCQLGLLDANWSPQPPILGESEAVTKADAQAGRTAGSPLDDASTRALAAALARRSIVLLRNEAAALPLAAGARLAVVGPRANVADAMFGCYSFPRHVGLRHPDVPLGIEVETVLDALRQDSAGYAVTFAEGCTVTGGDAETVAEAAAAAREADVCVAVLGDTAGLFGTGTSGEGCDVTDLRLPGRQGDLLDALIATGTPVVVVLLVGRPYELSRYADRLAGIVCAFFPGEEGGGAIADVLAGRTEPAGRLPVGFPAEGANQPSTYLAAALGRQNVLSPMVDQTALFPFGHGLSYNPAVWARVESTGSGTWPTDGTCRVAVTLRNTGTTATSEVVQIYLHDLVAEVARPVQLLVAAPRVDLAPGATRTVLVDLHADQTSYTGLAGRRIVDPGDVELWVGASSTDIRTTLPVRLTGPRREVGFDRRFQPEVSFVEG
ncbi:glycosyl hydrolase [Streptomyces fagopyri]|uniref:Glycosyl hydrolase n=1 Tax=Streptomyces fagopyri TaxID=2662397 RepID=A0A5Q0L5T5_9ACTN|nr:glycoside hydrolase family 3 N-terminal domain-containing protein [Streptomyces fagopyri]QFZ72134.1 glycosyl hydrolase [Streptomyces fagopyri]